MTVRSRVVLITGCSSGFGMLAALRLAGAGCCVYATMRDLGKRAAIDGEAARRGCSANIRVRALDVTDTASIKRVVEEIMTVDGRIDVLINNAGFGIGGFFEDLSDEDWRRQFDTNFFGVLNVTREVVPKMRACSSGRIINVSSMAAYSGTPAFSAYVSSKWALEGFSECLYMELKPFNIDVILVEPGSYRTRIFEDNARYAEGFFEPNSPYFALSRRLNDFISARVKKNERDPVDVAKHIENIVFTAHPRFRNIIGVVAKLRAWTVRHVPFEFYAWTVQKALFNGKPRA